MTGTSYFGGKSGSGTYQTIINQIPPHKHYIEGFAGMAGVFRKMKTLASCLLIEKDPLLFPTYMGAGFKETVSVFSYLRQRDEEKRMCINDSAIQLFYEHRLKFDTKDTFIYLDPPYPLDSRKSGPKYRYEMTNGEHRDLLTSIVADYQHARIAISTYPNKLYTAWLKGRWRVIEFESQTRHGKATEQLWMNYPEPYELQDYQYLGLDYRERERIARMQRRWKAKFLSLPDLEKKAMLQQLRQVADLTAI